MADDLKFYRAGTHLKACSDSNQVLFNVSDSDNIEGFLDLIRYLFPIETDQWILEMTTDN